MKVALFIASVAWALTGCVWWVLSAAAANQYQYATAPSDPLTGVKVVLCFLGAAVCFGLAAMVTALERYPQMKPPRSTWTPASWDVPVARAVPIDHRTKTE